MALEVSQNIPVIEDFTLLSSHQQETPASFFGAKAVLHLRCPDAKLRISSSDLSSEPVLKELDSETTQDDSTEDSEIVISGIDVWVSSSHLTLVSATKSKSIRIPYQTITVHAQEGDAALLGLNLSDPNTADEDLVFIQLRIIPTQVESFEQPDQNGSSEQTNGHTQGNHTAAQALFKAIADCQELNPDPPEGGGEDFDETAPGATGWITSENMQDFLDENGQFRMPEGITVIGGEDDEDEIADEPLGHGAGRTRTADEANGATEDETETKWQRTD